jgi:hypothetical protein
MPVVHQDSHVRQVFSISAKTEEHQTKVLKIFIRNVSPEPRPVNHLQRSSPQDITWGPIPRFSQWNAFSAVFFAEYPASIL